MQRARAHARTHTEALTLGSVLRAIIAGRPEDSLRPVLSYPFVPSRSLDFAAAGGFSERKSSALVVTDVSSIAFPPCFWKTESLLPGPPRRGHSSWCGLLAVYFYFEDFAGPAGPS